MTNQKRLHGLDRGQNAAMLISECQSAIIDPSVAMFPGLAEAVKSRRMLAHINILAAKCRDMKIPIIHCIIRMPSHDGDFQGASPLHSVMRRNTLLRVDNPASAIHPAIATLSHDIVSERSQGITGFHGSDLESVLRRSDADTVILTGVSTNLALIGMAIEAVNRGFAVVIPEDCTAGASQETHDHAIKYTLPILAFITDSKTVMANLCVRAG